MFGDYPIATVLIFFCLMVTCGRSEDNASTIRDLEAEIAANKAEVDAIKELYGIKITKEVAP